jgi:predicted nuclease of predicted toxin-antitoxin system
LLQNAGYDAATVYDQSLVGEVDEKIAAVCQAEQRIIVSLDTDFADIRVYPPQAYSGIIVMCLRQQDKLHVLSVVGRWVKALEKKRTCRRLFVDC